MRDENYKGDPLEPKEAFDWNSPINQDIPW